MCVYMYMYIFSYVNCFLVMTILVFLSFRLLCRTLLNSFEKKKKATPIH